MGFFNFLSRFFKTFFPIFFTAFFVLGQQQLNNCFWNIRVALRRAGFGETCAG